MQGQPNGARYMGICGVAAFAAVSLWIAVMEYRSYYAGAGTPPMFYIISENAFKFQALGLHSINRDIARCFKGLDDLQASVIGASAKKVAYENCNKLADRTLAHTPSHSAALQLKSEALWYLGNENVAIDYLQKAKITGPNIAWLAQRRLLLALRFENQQRAQMVEIVDSDILKLMQIEAIQPWLGQLYVQNQALHAIVNRNEHRFGKNATQQFLSAIEAAIIDRNKAEQVVN